MIAFFMWRLVDCSLYCGLCTRGIHTPKSQRISSSLRLFQLLFCWNADIWLLKSSLHQPLFNLSSGTKCKRSEKIPATVCIGVLKGLSAENEPQIFTLMHKPPTRDHFPVEIGCKDASSSATMHANEFSAYLMWSNVATYHHQY
ncbi:hypothetical protein M5K25_013574 [Dendrobium thyrsiflorum]|uniref:Uncharacterized protein n=1 Tax=Dendrobium thyrsiflorum TaxID=117978 RepID=A0ABD0V062_DENTH